MLPLARLGVLPRFSSGRQVMSWISLSDEIAALTFLLGREYFELAAMRHVPPAEAKKLRQANGLTVFLCGLIIAGIASVPILNFITPLFATAFMVHMYKDLTRRAGPRIAVRPA